MTTTRTSVDFWFDPICPWAWITSRWMVEAELVRPVSATWHVMSIVLLHVDDAPPDENGAAPPLSEKAAASLKPARLCVAAEQAEGPGTLLPLYTALGKRFHELAQPRTAETFEAALAEAGLPGSLAEAAETDELDHLLRSSHDAAIARVGKGVGTPVLSMGDFAIFGPVVSPVPRGEAAGRLWDAFALLAETDGFFELKRSRTRRPIVDGGSAA
jgi:hypothetical protein